MKKTALFIALSVITSTVYATQNEDVSIEKKLSTLIAGTLHAATDRADNEKILKDDLFIIGVESLTSTNPATKLHVKEALRYAAIKTPVNQQEVFNILMKSKLSDLNDIAKIQKQEVEYKKIKDELATLVKDVNVENNSRGVKCTSIDAEFMTVKSSKTFDKQLQPMDFGSADELYSQIFEKEPTSLSLAPTYSMDEALKTKLSVVSIPAYNLIKNDSRVKLDDETNYISMNSTAIILNKQVSDGVNTYVMNPYNIYKPTGSLSDETISQYAFYMLNLKEVNKFNANMYTSFKSIYAKNAGLCLYSSIK
jgi:hypothetical protein